MQFNIPDSFRRLIKQPQRRQQKQQGLDVVSSSEPDITYYYDANKTPEISDYLEKRFIPTFQWYKKNQSKYAPILHLEVLNHYLDSVYNNI